MKEFTIASIIIFLVAFAYFYVGQEASYPTNGNCFRQHADGNMTDNSGNVIIKFRDGDVLCTRFINKHTAEYYLAK